MRERSDIFENGISRRDFMKGTAYEALGFVLDRDRLGCTADSGRNPIPFDAKNPESRVVLIRDKNAVGDRHKTNPDVVADSLDTEVTHFVGENDSIQAWIQFFKTGDVVGIKYTQCGWMKVHTYLAVVEAIRSKLLELGVPDSRVAAGDAELRFRECTALINVPPIKVHALTGIAASIKNYINFVSNASAYHHAQSVKLGEIWHIADVRDKTRLIIVDALCPYFGPGPQINLLHQWDYKGVIVGTDPVDIDTVYLQLCQKKGNLFRKDEWPITPPPVSLAAADSKFKLGTSDPTKIKLERLGWDQDILI